ncbi:MULTISPECIES: phosphoenolpyruvate carboxykinase (ATP) [Allobacillus]|uniref:Phosphoenolpyruvate carboxykinase (ATP) n=1 Tax=Allobacillus halotolerans TaxID=570278 RepID=A0ABS6GPB3_9BACI|nr:MULTISPECIES: phosphoenolpyruvate carboxykinase (ATP) [Allobacillus]MBU6080318.1 phosphoenolpyruvate carboxykinase (ATP) [Allobacillus halotolerans]TSJ65111.1 phosphoenolpyruvate carboxykinase (ATP) [Allobacillus sp. SKP2-8]
MSTNTLDSLVSRLTDLDVNHQNLSVAELVEKVLSREEGVLSSTGAIRATTGTYTGRSPKDKFIVKDEESQDHVEWGSVNQPISEEKFENLFHKVIDYLETQNELFTFKGFAGADEKYRLPIQVITQFAWHNLFANRLFIRPSKEELENHQAGFTVVSAPHFKADPEVDGTNSETFIIVSFKHRIVLIGGTEYAGEIKKSIFSVMNYMLPTKNEVLPMHCSANVGAEGDVALFFGLSGTGKTTLSADPSRSLIGDDEHAWSQNGVFNIEGGCYAKTVNLSAEKEPQIFNAIRFGSVLENVILDENREADYDDTSLTENTRAAYSIDNIDNIVRPSRAGHPNTIIFLTADASGVLPPISKLSKEQAMYHFLSGYTSKLAGTERGVTEPQATFSACFGSPFLPLPAAEYAKMLGEKIDEHNSEVFLVNTGWTGGPYGEGSRMKLGYTRAMVQAALEGDLKNVETVQDDFFGLHIPTECPGVPTEVLHPKKTWADKDRYDQQAQDLAKKFHENFKQFDHVTKDIAEAGPTFRG